MTCPLVSANSYGFLKTVLYLSIVSSQVVSRAWIWRQCKIMNIYLLQWKVQCLWLGREMVFSDSPDGLGPAASALGVLGREVFAGCSPSGGCVARAEPTCQPRNRQAADLGMCMHHGGHCWVLCPTSMPLPRFLPGLQSWQRAQKHPTARPMKELRKWIIAVRVQMFLSSFLQRGWEFKITTWGGWKGLGNWETALQLTQSAVSRSGKEQPSWEYKVLTSVP